MTDPEAVPPAWFDRWWEPEEFFRAVVNYIGSLPSPDDVVTAPRYQRVREAYVGGFFAMIRDQHADAPVRVKLEADRFPDVNVRISDSMLLFEVVEVQRPDRRRGDEYREDADRAARGLPPRVRSADPLFEQRAAALGIANALESKASRHYHPAPRLLVYVNLWLISNMDDTLLNDIREAATPYRDAFPELWLLWKANVIRCWPDPVQHLAPKRLPPEAWK